MSLMTKYAFRDCCTITPCGVNPTSMAHVRGPCVYCGVEHEIGVWPDDLEKFRQGEYAQNCFHYLSADDREFLISGICGKCWDATFAEGDPDE